MWFVHIINSSCMWALMLGRLDILGDWTQITCSFLYCTLFTTCRHYSFQTGQFWQLVIKPGYKWHCPDNLGVSAFCPWDYNRLPRLVTAVSNHTAHTSRAVLCTQLSGSDFQPDNVCFKVWFHKHTQKDLCTDFLEYSFFFPLLSSGRWLWVDFLTSLVSSSSSLNVMFFAERSLVLFCFSIPWGFNILWDNYGSMAEARLHPS